MSIYLQKLIAAGLVVLATLASTGTAVEAGGWGKGPSWKQAKKDAGNVARETGEGIVKVGNIISTGLAGSATSNRQNGGDGADGQMGEETKEPQPVIAPTLPLPDTNGRVTITPVITNRAELLGLGATVSPGQSSASVSVGTDGTLGVGGSHGPVRGSVTVGPGQTPSYNVEGTWTFP